MLIDVDWLPVRWVSEEMLRKGLFVRSWIWFNAFTREFVLYVGVSLDKGSVYVGNAGLKMVVFVLV